MTISRRYYYAIILTVLSLLFTLILAIVAPLQVIADVSGAYWHGTVRVYNSGTATSGVSTNFTLSTQGLVNNNFMNSYSDASILYNGSTVPFMPGYSTNPWCVFVSTIGAGQNLNYDLYTGNVTGGKIAYFPGTNGMSVNDAASLEFSNNFTLAFTDTYFDTSAAQVGQYIYRKPYAFSVFNSAANTISANISTTGAAGTGYPSIVSSSQGTGTAATVPATASSTYLLQGNLLLVYITVFDVAGAVSPALTAPGGFTQLYSQNYGLERGGAWYKILTGTETSPFTWTVDRNSYYCFETQIIDSNTYLGLPVAGVAATGAGTNPDPPNLVSGFGAVDTKYIAVSHSRLTQGAAPAGYGSLYETGSNSAYVALSFKNAVAASDNPGTYGAASAAWAANTIAIKGQTGFTISGTVVSGEHDLSVYADSVNFKMDADGVNIASTALGTVSVPNNSNNIQIGSAGATPYITSVSITVGGNLKGSWNWEYGATFTDDSGNGNTATPSFRTTSSDADVSATLISLDPVTESQFTSSGAGGSSGIVLGAPTAPIKLYTDEDYSKIPGADVANALIDASGTTATDRLPREMWWFPFIFGIIGVAGLCLYGVTTHEGSPGSLWPSIIFIEVAYILAGLLNPIGFFGAILFFIPAITCLTADKHYSMG